MRTRRLNSEAPRAACADALALVDAAYERPGGPEADELSRRYCRHCPLKYPCGEAGFMQREEGVWGGMTPKTRTQRGGPPSKNTNRRS